MGDAYALYVDDPAAIFFGAGLDPGFPHGNFEDQPGTGFAFKGGLKGAIGLGGGFPFDFEGYVAVQVNAAGRQRDRRRREADRLLQPAQHEQQRARGLLRPERRPLAGERRDRLPLGRQLLRSPR